MLSQYAGTEIPGKVITGMPEATEGKMKQGGRLEEDGLISIARQSLVSGKREKLLQSLTINLDSLLAQPLADDLTIVCATRLE